MQVFARRIDPWGSSPRLDRLTSVEEPRCPYCHADLAGQPTAYCPLCNTPHHTLCFHEGGCTVLGCSGVSEPRSAVRAARPYRRAGRLLLAAGVLLGTLMIGAATREGMTTHHPYRSCSPKECDTWAWSWTKNDPSRDPARLYQARAAGYTWIWDKAAGAVRIKSVRPGSRAEVAGAREGDLIESFEDVAADDHRFHYTGSHHLDWPEFTSIERVDGVRVRALGVSSPARPWERWAYDLVWLLPLLLFGLGLRLWTWRRAVSAEGTDAPPSSSPRTRSVIEKPLKA